MSPALMGRDEMIGTGTRVHLHNDPSDTGAIIGSRYNPDTGITIFAVAWDSGSPQLDPPTQFSWHTADELRRIKAVAT